jgi:hypothetical protein
MSSKIKRNCVVCGKRMQIQIDESGKYDKGHYFGTMKIPVEGTGKYIKTGKVGLGDITGDVVRWTGKEREAEYWECEKCFNEE